MKKSSKFKVQSSKIKLKKGDLVVVTVGKDKGRQAKIERVFPKDGTVLLPGLNQYKKHRKKQSQDRPGEILTLSRPYLVAKVALVCPKCKQQTRIGWRSVGEKKVRFCRKCDQTI
jgi:large subunit ribosomal protein L24